MKIYIIAIILLFACINSVFSQVPADSLKYCKTGTFRYQGMYSDKEIKRTASTQIEYNYNKTEYIKMKVKWAAPDQYWLIYESSKNTPVTDESKRDTLKVTITYADRFKYSCHFAEAGHSGDCTFTREP